MWQETKHGLFKQFIFKDFSEAFEFMSRVANLAEEDNYNFRWENEWNVVQIWLSNHDGKNKITDKEILYSEKINNLEASNQNTLEPIDKISSSNKKLIIYADGGSRGNPGPSSSGYVIFDENNKMIVDKGVYLGVTTNNQAEYTALKLALENCLAIGAQEVQVYMDSLLVINQMKGIFKVRNRDLWPIHDAIKTLASKLKKISYQHVPRELNKLADAAVNRALDDQLTNSTN